MELRFNNIQYNDIPGPGLTMVMSLTEHQIFPVIMIKSLSQTTGIHYEMLNKYSITKQTFITFTIIIIITTLFYKGNTYYHIDNLKWPLKYK